MPNNTFTENDDDEGFATADTVTNALPGHSDVYVGELVQLFGVPVLRNTAYMLRDPKGEEGSEHFLVFSTPGSTNGLCEEDLIEILLHRLTSQLYSQTNEEVSAAIAGLRTALSSIQDHRHSIAVRGTNTHNITYAFLDSVDGKGPTAEKKDSPAEESPEERCGKADCMRTILKTAITELAMDVEAEILAKFLIKTNDAIGRLK